MEARIQRDINNSGINEEKIKKHLQEELQKKAEKINGLINNLTIGAKRNHSDLISNNQLLYNQNISGKMNEFVDKTIQGNFKYNRINNASPFHKVREPSIEILNDQKFNYAAKKQKVEFIKEIIEDPTLMINCYAFYGQIPIYVDVQNREKIITKAGKFVEIHEIISNYLLIHDEKYKLLNTEFESKLKDDMMKKPFSVLQIDRNIRDKAEKISLQSLNEDLINENEAKINLNALVLKNELAGNQNLKAIKNYGEKFVKESIKLQDEFIRVNQIKERLNHLKNDNQDYPPNKYSFEMNEGKDLLNFKEKFIQKENIYLDSLINDLIKNPKNKQKISEENNFIDSEKQEKTKTLSIYNFYLNFSKKRGFFG